MANSLTTKGVEDLPKQVTVAGIMNKRELPTFPQIEHTFIPFLTHHSAIQNMTPLILHTLDSALSRTEWLKSLTQVDRVVLPHRGHLSLCTHQADYDKKRKKN